MNASKVVPRVTALGVGFLLLAFIIFHEAGVSGFFIYVDGFSVLPLGIAVCFTAFAYGPHQVLASLAMGIHSSEIHNPDALDHAARVMDTLGRTAKACGWIAVLIGGIVVLQNLEDPKKIGGGLSLILFSVLYAYLFHAAICLPCRDSLRALAQERRSKP